MVGHLNFTSASSKAFKSLILLNSCHVVPSLNVEGDVGLIILILNAEQLDKICIFHKKKDKRHFWRFYLIFGY